MPELLILTPKNSQFLTLVKKSPNPQLWQVSPISFSTPHGLSGGSYDAGDPGSIPGLGRSPGEGDGCPLQYSCLENPMDRGAWWATVRGITKSQTRHQITLSLSSLFNPGSFYVDSRLTDFTPLLFLSYPSDSLLYSLS